jgi:hypothetical protein
MHIPQNIEILFLMMHCPLLSLMQQLTKLRACILTSRYVAANGIVYQIIIFNGFVVLIILEHPGFRNMPARWVPKQVSTN